MKLKENDNVPEIRFDYFKEEWDEKRFKDFTKLSQGLQIAISSRFLEDGENRYFYITNEFLNPNSTKKYYIESPSENVICTVDDILMTRTGNTGKVITNISGAFHNNFFKVDYDNFKTSKMFLYYLLTSNNIHKEIIIRAGNSTIPDLNHSDFYSIKSSVPSLPEQTAIGSLFRTLDDLLAGYKDNLANYQSLKATMLAKMFPKAGQTVPEIRLDGFEGEWELLEINDLADDFQSGGTPKTNVQEYWDGEIPWIQSSDLETDCLFEIKVQKSISEKGLKKSSAKIIPKDSIAVVTRVGVGKLAVMRHEYATSQDFLSLSNLKSNIEFTAYLLYRLLQKEVTQLQGTSIKGITKVELLSKKVLIPSLSEQQAIGTYFSNLDNLIAAHQEKISQLETLKKKLLQDMFI